ncbi:MAG: hypothetical protein E7031_02590 [Akkermansiaceae bacterium]|nr:hypothetical protein [Akkermansiaceae bacterium]
MKYRLTLTALLLTAFCSCESVRTVYDENGKVVVERDGARERSLNDYFEEEFDANFTEQKNKDGVPQATSHKVSSYQKDIDAARRGDKEYATGSYNAGGTSSFAGREFSGSSERFDGNKRFDGFSGNSQYNTDMRPAFMSESKGVARTAYNGHSAADRYSAEGANYDASGRIYATHDSGISTTDTSGYFESRKEKWGKPTIISSREYYKRTIDETRTMLGRDN